MNKQSNIKNQRTKFLRYAELEPELLELEAAILEYTMQNQHNHNFCANAAWYGYGSGAGIHFKKGVVQLVGWRAKSDHAKMKTQTAYTLVYKYLYSLLPDCGHDGMCR